MSFNLFDILAVLLSGAISSMGLGGGGVLLLYLSLFKNMQPLEAQGLNLMFFLPACVTSLIVYIKNKIIVFDIIKPMLFGSLVGVITGKLLLNSIPPHFLRLVFAVFLIITGLFTIVSAKSKKKGKN